jgi:hypothetical protein
MKPSLARIERFVQTWEASLAPPVDRTAWMQHLDNRDEMQRHLAAHPRDVAMAQWLAWLWDERPSGETAVLPSHVALRRPAAPAATDPHVSVEKPEPKKPETPSLMRSSAQDDRRHSVSRSRGYGPQQGRYRQALAAHHPMLVHRNLPLRPRDSQCVPAHSIGQTPRQVVRPAATPLRSRAAS